MAVGGDFLLTHFLFLLVQLVGCAPTSGLWGLWNNHFTVLFVTAGQKSYTDSAESLGRAPVACNIHSCPLGVLLRICHCHCTVDLWSVQAWKYFYVHPAPFLSWRLSSVCAHLHLSMCVCDLLPLFLHLSLTGKPQADWIGNTPLFLSHPPYSSSVFSLCHLFPCAMEQKLSLEWLDISLLTLCPLPFMFESFDKKVLSWIFILFINFSYSFLGYPREYWFNITPDSSLLLFSSFCWVPPQLQAAAAQQAEQYIQTALTYHCNWWLFSSLCLR